MHLFKIFAQRTNKSTAVFEHKAEHGFLSSEMLDILVDSACQSIDFKPTRVLILVHSTR